jgi:hypothetical protein
MDAQTEWNCGSLLFTSGQICSSDRVLERSEITAVTSKILSCAIFVAVSFFQANRTTPSAGSAVAMYPVGTGAGLQIMVDEGSEFPFKGPLHETRCSTPRGAIRG